jgi:HK97 family phage portal protein
MGFLRQFRSDPAVVTLGGFKNAAQVLLGDFGRTESNEIVNHHTALHVPVVFACVKIISEKIATLPLMVYEVTRGRGKQVAFDHDYYDMVHNRPNPFQDSANFRTAIMASVLLEGNAYVELERDNANRVVNMWHRNSYRTEPVIELNKKVAYRTLDGNTQGRIIPVENMVHIMGVTLDGFRGMSPVEYQRRSMGQQIAMDKFSSRFFANYATPQLALINPAEMAPESKAKARQDWEKLQSGSNQHRIAILDNGFDIKQLGVTQDQAQFLETKLASKRDVYSIFGVPGHMVGDSEKGVKANVEQQAQDFLTNCLQPWLTKLETAFNVKLFSTLGRSAGKYEVRFNTRDLLRPDAASRTTFYSSGIQNGYLNLNDVREFEGLNPIGPVGNRHFIQLNMQLADDVGEEPVNGVPQTIKPEQDSDTELEDEQEENALPLKRLKAQYRGLFRDAVGRFAIRNSKDTETAAHCLRPVLETISFAFQNTSNPIVLPLDPLSETSKAIVKLCEGVAHRSAQWDVNDLDAVTEVELKRAIKSLVYAALRDEAAAKASAALKVLDEADEDNANEA